MEHARVGTVRLRALTKDDCKTSWSWRNKDEIRDFYSGHPFYVNREKEEAWLDKVINSDLPLTSFGIEKLESNCLIGMAFLKDIDLIHRTAEFAIFIGDEESRGKGHGKEATLKTLKFAFNDLNLNRVYLTVLEENKKALHIYAKFGFKNEGILRECVYKNGKYKNEVIMSLLRSEYMSNKK